MARSVSDIAKMADKKLGVIGRQPAKCDTHGDYSAVMLKDGGVSGCPVCASAKREMESYSRKREQFELMHRSSARIPPRFAGKTFDDYVIANPGQQIAFDACTAYADDWSKHRRDGRCMLLMGKVGTGKTHLAIAIANFLIAEHMVKAIYRTVGTVMGDIRSTFNDRSGQSEQQVMRELTGSELLILDEVGATKQSEFELVTLFNVINGRYERGLPTIIVSNLAPSELADAIGTRCVDRVRENGCIGVAFDWESQRGKEGF